MEYVPPRGYCYDRRRRGRVPGIRVGDMAREQIGVNILKNMVLVIVVTLATHPAPTPSLLSALAGCC
eukprot:3474626-Pyramimonas_sp.AAC.1